mmetsp:Transcript_39907/g.65415  ORF Transcript_39907/g.65415 Transcript_39907/m.65415 type:complete len:220 (-) Transcript_39907:429-1088(-)
MWIRQLGGPHQIVDGATLLWTQHRSVVYVRALLLNKLERELRRIQIKTAVLAIERAFAGKRTRFKIAILATARIIIIRRRHNTDGLTVQVDVIGADRAVPSANTNFVLSRRQIRQRTSVRFIALPTIAVACTAIESNRGIIIDSIQGKRHIVAGQAHVKEYIRLFWQPKRVFIRSVRWRRRANILLAQLNRGCWLEWLKCRLEWCDGRVKNVRAKNVHG